MSSKRLSGVVILVMAFIIGCSGDYGLVRRQTPADSKMTLAELIENWEDYHIYYGKPAGSLPKNIMFDPKNNETMIVGDGWHKIADQQTLLETIKAAQTHWEQHEVMVIEGPDRQFFGYMYCSWDFGIGKSWTPSIYDVTLVDERTVHVFQGV